MLKFVSIVLFQSEDVIWLCPLGIDKNFNVVDNKVSKNHCLQSPGGGGGGEISDP